MFLPYTAITFLTIMKLGVDSLIIPINIIDNTMTQFKGLNGSPTGPILLNKG
jgi:hypothetical protein